MERILPTIEPGASDGRVRRSERSRESIVVALLELIGSGVAAPTARQVAERGGVGIRSVFRHFSEMESLYAAMDARLEGEVRRMFLGGDRSGSLEERAVGFVRQRAAVFERVAPFKRAANLQRPRSSFLEQRHRGMQRELRSDLLAWLPELRSSNPAVVDAFDLLGSFEAWDRLRTDQGLGAKAVVAALERLARSLAKDLVSASGQGSTAPRRRASAKRARTAAGRR
ncbi:MAG: TetR/AcrR family transcriptional regulator [Alphaproteobacteria bacterium]